MGKLALARYTNLQCFLVVLLYERANWRKCCSSKLLARGEEKQERLTIWASGIHYYYIAVAFLLPPCWKFDLRVRSLSPSIYSRRRMPSHSNTFKVKKGLFDKGNIWMLSMYSLYPIIDGWYHHDMDYVKHARDLRMNGCICVILSMQSDWKSPEIVLFKSKTLIQKRTYWRTPFHMTWKDVHFYVVELMFFYTQEYKAQVFMASGVTDPL